MKCERILQVADLADYLDNDRLIAHYCGFDIMKPLHSYWTYDRFLKKLDTGELKEIMAEQVKKLYELGIVDASFIGLDSTPVAANTKQNDPKSFAKISSSRRTIPKLTRTAPWAFIPRPTSMTSGVVNFTGNTKTMCW